MTINDFLAQLKLILSNPHYPNPRYITFFDDVERIRIKDETGNCFCPLTLVCREITGYLFDENQADDAAWAMGFDWYDAYDIVVASDRKHHPLRSKLIELLLLAAA